MEEEIVVRLSKHEKKRQMESFVFGAIIFCLVTLSMWSEDWEAIRNVRGKIFDILIFSIVSFNLIVILFRMNTTFAKIYDDKIVMNDEDILWNKISEIEFKEVFLVLWMQRKRILNIKYQLNKKVHTEYIPLDIIDNEHRIVKYFRGKASEHNIKIVDST